MFNVIIDTRERNPLFLQSDMINEVVFKKLDTGDYTIQGHENNLCIERKKNVTELAGNIVEKRFQREIERMSLIPHSYLLLEFSFNDILEFPNNSGIPFKKRKYVRIKPKFIISCLSKYEKDYRINVVYADSHVGAEIECLKIMSDYYAKYINV